MQEMESAVVRRQASRGLLRVAALGVACALIVLLGACSATPRSAASPSVKVVPFVPHASDGCSDEDQARDPEAPANTVPTQAPQIELLPQLPMTPERVRPSWGPGRPLYTFCRPASRPTLNSIVDHGRNVDETWFYYFKGSGSETLLRDVELRAGDSYTAYIYFWNSVATNIPDGDAVNATMSLDFPHSVTQDTVSRATACADNAVPKCVWMEMALHTESAETLLLDVREDSVQMRSSDRLLPVDWKLLSSEGGVPLGCGKSDGVLSGEPECAGWISFSVDVKQPKVDISVNTSNTSSFSTQIRNGSEIQITATYSNDSGEAIPGPLDLGLTTSPGLEPSPALIQVNRFDPNSLAWTGWAPAERRVYEPDDMQWVRLSEGIPAGGRVSVSMVYTADAGGGSQCGGSWVEVKGYIFYEGVVQWSPEVISVDASC